MTTGIAPKKAPVPGRGREWAGSARTSLRGRLLNANTGVKGVIGVIALIALIPVGILITLSLYDKPVLSVPGNFTLGNYQSLLADSATWSYLWTTLLFTAGGAIVAVVIGTLMAFAVTTVNVPFPNILRVLPLGTLLAPGLLRDSSWLMLFSDHTGLVNFWLKPIIGTDSLINVSTLPGVIVAAGVFTSPVAYVVMLGPLGSLDRSFLEASNMAGARFARTFVRIVIPMVRPAVISAAILVMLTIAASFETPVILGAPGGVVTYMTLIYRTVSSSSLELNTAATQAILYLIVTAVVMIFYMRATRNERRFVVVSGKGNTPATLRSTGLRIVLTVIILLQAILGFIAPILVTFAVSFVPYFTTTGGNPFRSWTLANYQSLIADPQVEQAIVSSTFLAIATVIGALLIGGLISYVALKGGFQHARWIELIGMAPLAVPPTVYSVGLLLTVLASPAIAAFAYGSVWVMFIASVFAFLPIVTRLLTSALIQIQDDLLHAATVSGASRLHTIRTILVPLLRPAVASAAAVVFMLSYRELGAIVLLVSNNTQLIPSVIFRYLEGGNFTQVAALNIIMIVVPIVFAFLAFSLGAGRRSNRLRAARSLISSETPLTTNEGVLDVA